MSSFELEDAGLDVLFHSGESKSPLKTHSTYIREYVIGHAGPRITLKSGDMHHSLWGNHLWNSSLEAAKCLEKIDDISTKSILELGAGLGLPSIVGALLGAKNVVATDYPDERLLSTLQSNINRNFNGKSLKPPIVQPLLWGTSNDISRVLFYNAGCQFDIIILSDLIFNHVCHEQLLFTILELLDIGGTCITTYGHHVPHRRTRDLNFFNLATRYRLYPTEALEVEYDLPNAEIKEREITNLVFVRELRFETKLLEANAREAVYTDILLIGTTAFHASLGLYLSKAGKQVLTLDESNFYGGASSTLPLIDLYIHCRKHSLPLHVYSDGEGIFSSDIAIDIRPRILPSQGSWANFLVEEEIDKYIEFDEITPITMFHHENLWSLPVTKSDVFTNEKLSFIEKRKVCQLLQIIAGVSDFQPTVRLKAINKWELLSDAIKSLDFSQLLEKWIVHAILQLDIEEAEHISIVDTQRRTANLWCLMEGSNVGHLVPSYGQCDLIEGILRGGSIRGLSSMVGQNVLSVEQKTDKDTTVWSIKTGNYDITSRVIVAEGLGKKHISSSFLILSKEQIELQNSETRTLQENSITVIPPRETDFVQKYIVRIFTKRSSDRKTHIYHFHSFCPLSELASLGNHWAQTRFCRNSVLFTCGWDQSLFADNKFQGLNELNFISSLEDDDIYYSSESMDRMKELAKDVCDRVDRIL